MSNSFKRQGPDKLQKFFLYLILSAWLMLIWLALNLRSMSSKLGMAASCLLLLFNLLLVSICVRRARRVEDGYLIYPVVGSAIGCFVLTAWYFFS